MPVSTLFSFLVCIIGFHLHDTKNRQNSMTVNRGHTERAENEKEKLTIFNYKGQCSGVPLRELRAEGDFTPSILN